MVPALAAAHMKDFPAVIPLLAVPNYARVLVHEHNSSTVGYVVFIAQQGTEQRDTARQSTAKQVKPQHSMSWHSMV